MWDNIRSALYSIWGNKLRSLLTVLGVIIGVSSVTILIALGQGLKKDVSNLIEGFGTNVVTVIPGKIDTSKGATQPNPADLVNGDLITLTDVQGIQTLPSITAVTPASLVSGLVSYHGKTINPTLMGVYPNVLSAFQVFTLERGTMFGNSARKTLILNAAGKDALFPDEDPVGKTVLVGKDEFVIGGVLAKPKNSNSLSSEFNVIAFIPFEQAKIINKNQVKINRLIIKAADTADIKAVKASIKDVLLRNHGGVDNVTVLTQDDLLGLFDQFLNLATALVSAIAAISLLVGGIGIMNIMLVTVTERTREIGLRKALGATQGAIALQFLTEAVVVTVVGGLLGLAFAYGAGQLIALKTPLKPEFSWQVVLVTLSISLAIGITFGLWPALRAAKKDPIDALRYE